MQVMFSCIFLDWLQTMGILYFLDITAWVFVCNWTFRSWRLNETGIYLRLGAYYLLLYPKVSWTNDFSSVALLTGGL